ncbi:MAG: porin, partial [Myxococcota bacterium]|nr:porin [Myxococcota bacterium]
VKLRAFDTAQGFSLNWIGLNGSYAADPIGGTISLRFGPGAVTYHGSPLVLGASSSINPSDNSIGLQNVRQAYATWKPADKVTLDFGKFDQPYGSEVPDSQLNMEYTRSLLFTLNQPVFFTGFRLDYAPTDTFDAKLIVANGWNNSIDNNRAKSFGAQVSFKPVDSLQLYLGYMAGPEQVDVQTVAAGMPPMMASAHVADANSHWRHLVDLVVDFNPTKEFRLLLNGDYDTEEKVGATGDHAAIWYGANLALRYIVADPFQITLRGEYFHDEHGDILGTGTSTNVESGTLTLQYVIASHLALMLDNRIDVADNNTIFFKSANTSPDDATKTQFTTTLGVIASTK